ncbi:MAG TPA: P22 phage major capsid protein family protein [Rhodanobacter sp.]|nr:P22 phage major capsid protein family protein [Rhodanobacter sp.]
MANTITSLIPDLYSALDVVSRELVGFIPAVSRDSTFERAAVGQTVRSFVAPASTASNITPGVTPPDDGDQTIGQVPLTLTKARRVPVRWNGEQSLGLNNGGPGVLNVRAQQFAQAMRTLTNEIETDVAGLFVNASRASGTAGTTPFASNLSDPAAMRKILSDNGQWTGDMHGVIDTTSGAALRTLAQLTKANEAGDTSMLRQGEILNIHGFALRESAKVAQGVAVGTGASYVTNAAAYPVGSTAITIATGTGTILPGDIVTFAGDTKNQYVVAAGVAAPGVLTIAAPGLQQALPASAKAITVVAAATRNMFFARHALQLATRAPALPDGGDSAIDRHIITDPRSGLSFEVAMYAQYRQMQYEISAVWGVACTKPEALALLLG